MESNLKNIRNAKRLSLQALGDMCGITKSHMHCLENDKSLPRIDTAYGIAKVLGHSVYNIWPDTTEVVEETITVRRIKTN